MSLVPETYTLLAISWKKATYRLTHSFMYRAYYYGAAAAEATKSEKGPPPVPITPPMMVNFACLCFIHFSVNYIEIYLKICTPH